MSDDIEFGGADELTEEELPEGMSTVDVDAVDEVDDSDTPIDDTEASPVKRSPLDDDEEGKEGEEEVDTEEASYFFDEDKGFDAR